MQIGNWINREEKNNVWKGVAAGLIGGLVASYAMNQFHSLLSKVKDEGNGKKEQEQEPATVKAAEAISEGVFDHEMDKGEKKVAGPAMHYAFGATVGGVYGAMAEYAPVVATGAGVPFGTAVWLGADEVAVPLFGLSDPPTEHPLSTHVSALAAHVVYGLTADIVRRSVRRLL